MSKHLYRLDPQLRHRKQRSIQSVVNVAVHLHNAGEWDAYCDSITKLLGMADAFYGLDDRLYNYTMDWVNVLSRFSLQRTTLDFPTWAIGQALKPFNGLSIAPQPEPLPDAAQGPLDPDLAAQNLQVATEYLDERPQLRGRGVVVIFKGQVAGWMNELRSPESWEPGCIALDRRGNQYLAIGGDAFHGATAWNPVWTTKQAGAAT